MIEITGQKQQKEKEEEKNERKIKGRSNKR